MLISPLLHQFISPKRPDLIVMEIARLLAYLLACLFARHVPALAKMCTIVSKENKESSKKSFPQSAVKRHRERKTFSLRRCRNC